MGDIWETSLELKDEEIIAIRNEWKRIKEAEQSIPQMRIALCKKYGMSIDTIRRIGEQ
jgi:hypothetical protein